MKIVVNLNCVPQDRVVVSRPFMGLCGMQVCACKDATNEEILEVANAKNPSGTTLGWNYVVREVKEESLFKDKRALPVQCDDYPDRLHFIVLC
jgi:hypothetical protein